VAAPAAAAIGSATAPGWDTQTGVPAATATATGPTPTIVKFNPSGPEPTMGRIVHGRQGITRGRHPNAGRILHNEEGAVV
jgi:hypothetical protein